MMKTVAGAFVLLCSQILVFAETYGNAPKYIRESYGSQRIQNSFPLQNKEEKEKTGKYYYGGTFKGKCGLDGLYFKDEISFVICSNSNAYKQPCAPGTRNAANNRYQPGYYYGYSDFCNINLVDYGYGPDSFVVRAAAANDAAKSKPSQTNAGRARDAAASNQPSWYKNLPKKTYKAVF